MMPMQETQTVNMYSNEMKIEELIKPFQEKIKKLEDEIREKDLEIAQLKVKLYQNKKSNNNQKFMGNNMKQINMMNNNMNNMNQINQMNMMNNNMNMMNNNMNQMNTMNNNMNQMNMMNNNMNQMNNNVNQMNNNMNNMNQINMMNNNMNQMNNNMNQMNNNMNQINNPINHMNNIGNKMGMYNMNNNMNMMNIPMNQMNNNIMNNPMFQMCNQINLMENQMSNMQIMNPKIIKFLSLTVKMEDGHQIMIQTKSDEKMKEVITKFCCKACYQIDDYDFNIIKVRKSKLDSTVEENEFDAKEDYILAKKKTKNNNENNNLKSNEESNDNKKYILDKNFQQNILPRKKIDFVQIEEYKLLGEKINITFNDTTGFKLVIAIGLQNTFKDAAMIFCKYYGLEPSVIRKNLIFLYNGSKIDVWDERSLGQIGFNNDSKVVVLDQTNLIGA